MINIIIEGTQGAGKSTQANKIVNANMPANLIYINADIDTKLTEFYNNPPAFGTNIAIIEVVSENGLRHYKRLINDWRRKVDANLIAIFEIQTP